MSRVSVGNFLSHRSKKLCRGTVLCLRKTLLSKILCRGAVGVSRLSVEIVFFPATETFRRGTLLCFTKFRVSKTFRHENRISQFSVKIFCLRVPESFLGERLCVSGGFWCRKILWMRRCAWGGRECNVFPSKTFHLTLLKTFLWEPFSVSLVSGIEKCWG